MTRIELRSQLAANIAAMRKYDKPTVQAFCRQMHNAGHTRYSIAKITGINYQTLRRWGAT